MHLKGSGQVAFLQADGTSQPAVRSIAASADPQREVFTAGGRGMGRPLIRMSSRQPGAD